MAEQQIIAVDSAARVSTYSSGATRTADFVVNLNAPVAGKKSVALSALNLPNVFQYATVSAANNIINFNDGGVLTATVASGTYSGATLAAAVQAALNTASAGYTVAYSSATRLFTISKATPFSLLWASGAAAPAGTNTSARNVLGFLAVDLSGTNSYTSDFAPLFTPTSVYVQMDTATVTITAGANDRINLNDGASKTATVAAGSYTAQYFAAAVQTALNAVSSSFTVTVDAVTGKFAISRSSTFSLLWASGANAAISAQRELGFERTDVTPASGPPYVATSVYNPFANAASVSVTPDSLGVNSGRTSAGVPFAWAVPVSAAPGAAQTTFPASSASVRAAAPVSYLHVRLVDSAGNTVALAGTDWNFAISFT